VADNAAALNVDASRLALCGDSAGGNLRPSSRRWRDSGGPAIAFTALIYPAVDMT
jgi:acetyl esterase